MNAVNPPEQAAIEQLDQHLLPTTFAQAMRHFASAVSVVTVEHQGRRSGFTATSVASFCASPPTLLVSTQACSSSAHLLAGSRRFAVNLLAPQDQAVAQRFTGFGGEQGEQRYQQAQWLQASAGGAPLLASSVVALDCCVEETLERHGQLLVFGRVLAIHAPQPPNVQAVQPPLLYWQGQYRQLGEAL